ncbi:MAG: ABC transporter permease subunit [Alphaproteobacteria bacterium]|nr:ABC transporter permease subunit [Alphaproteobacteria bacterium]
MKRLGYNLLGIATALALWELAGRWVGANLFAPPTLVLVEFAQLARNGQIFVELAASLRQMLVGFGLACLIGLPAGVAMGRSSLVDALFHPWLSMFVVTSVAALVPLFVLVFGTGFWFRAAIVFVASVWYVMLTVYQGARGIEPRFIDVGRSFSAGRLQAFWTILLPALYPYIVAAMRIGLVHAIRAMVVAEMFIILGYGGMIYRAGYAISTAPLLALLVTLMLVSIAANEVLRVTGRWLAPWYEERTASTGAQRI